MMKSFTIQVTQPTPWCAVSLALFLIATSAPAQWPGSPLNPKVLATGPQKYAADLHATPDGGVIAVCDTAQADSLALKIVRFNRDGALLWENTMPTPYPATLPAVRYQISPYKGVIPAEGDWLISTEMPRGPELEVKWTYLVIEDSGVKVESFTGGFIPKQVVTGPGANSIFLLHQPQQKLIFMIDLTRNVADSITYDTSLVTNFHARMVDATNCLFTYTSNADIETRSQQVQIASFTATPFINYHTRPALEQKGIAQDHGRVTSYTTSGTMVSWISDPDVNPTLYTTTCSFTNTELTTPVLSLTGVADYVTTNSTLGLPVFAAVIRNTASYPPLDTLIGGIINPENGGTAHLTVASAPDIKVKTLRQETDGNFSLVYSIPENGTNLLKVRRVSGTTAATLWETTVADLGVASDEKLKIYPNTFVSGNDESALFILSRKDEPGTANTTFQLVRLNANGQLGI